MHCLGLRPPDETERKTAPMLRMRHTMRWTSCFVALLRLADVQVWRGEPNGRQSAIRS